MQTVLAHLWNRQVSNTYTQIHAIRLEFERAETPICIIYISYVASQVVSGIPAKFPY